MSERVKAIIRLIIALVPVFNIVLVQAGKSPLPFTQDEVNAGLKDEAGGEGDPLGVE